MISGNRPHPLSFYTEEGRGTIGLYKSQEVFAVGPWWARSMYAVDLLLGTVEARERSLPRKERQSGSTKGR